MGMLEKEPVVSGEDMLSYFLNVPSASPMPSPRSSEGLETGFDLLEHLGFSQTTKEQMFVELVLSQLDKKISGADLLEALQSKNLLEAGQKARLEEHLRRRTSRSVARCSTSTCSRTKGSRCKVPEPKAASTPTRATMSSTSGRPCPST